MLKLRNNGAMTREKRCDGSEDEDEEDHSLYYEHLAERMTHSVPENQIRRLKHKHHPSRKLKVKHDDDWFPWKTTRYRAWGNG